MVLEYYSEYNTYGCIIMSEFSLSSFHCNLPAEFMTLPCKYHAYTMD